LPEAEIVMDVLKRFEPSYQDDNALKNDATESHLKYRRKIAEQSHELYV
jgi:hypothetical protein